MNIFEKTQHSTSWETGVLYTYLTNIANRSKFLTKFQGCWAVAKLAWNVCIWLLIRQLTEIERDDHERILLPFPVNTGIDKRNYRPRTCTRLTLDSGWRHSYRGNYRAEQRNQFSLSFAYEFYHKQ